jgi:hypothetical protein
MSVADVVVGPSCFLDSNGNAIVPFTSTQQLNDTLIAVTTASGQFLVPMGAFIGPNPGNQTVAGSCVVSASYAKSQSLI